MLTQMGFDPKRSKGVRPLLGFLIFALSFSPPLYAMGRKPHKEFPVLMKVDFGPAGKPAREEKIFVEKGTTPKEAVSQVFPVLSGKTCCSFREIMEIDGVRVEPSKNRWWICKVNGSKKISPAKTKLKSGDAVEWTYVEEAQ